MKTSLTLTRETSHQQVRHGSAMRIVLQRFGGYLTGDALNYILGFCIYGWLVRILTNSQYGNLSIATSVYQVLMMVAASGIDFVGPGILHEHPDQALKLISRFERLRILVASTICLPILLCIAISYYHAGNRETAVLTVVSFSMVLARGIDISYVAVAYGLPGPMAKSRILGLGIYLAAILALSRVAAGHLWLVPVLNAGGVTIGRMRLKHRLKGVIVETSPRGSAPIKSARILMVGMKASAGQLLMLGFQTLDVVYLSRYVSIGIIGQYSMVARLYLFGTAVLTSAYYAFLPSLLKSRDQEFHRVLRRCVGLSLGIGLLGLLAFCFISSPLMELLAKRHLPVVHSINIWFGVAFLALAIATPLYSVLASFKQEHAYLVAMILGFSGMAITDLLLIPRFGVIGAAAGQVMAVLFVLGYSAFAILRMNSTVDNPEPARAYEY